MEEDKHATVTRIRGQIHVSLVSAFDGTVGLKTANLALGIQVVNLAQNVAGSERNPAQADDLEGGEWMWLRHYSATWRVTSGVDTPPDWFIPVGGDVLLGGQPPDVDVKAQRKIDLSQDEVMLSGGLITSAKSLTTVPAVGQTKKGPPAGTPDSFARSGPQLCLCEGTAED